jgi:tripartite-type tricarboxylate transporter receptor subunit TctC
MPVDLAERWNKELVKVLADPSTREEMLKHGLEPHPGTRDELGKYIKTESDKWAKVILEAKITGE